MVQFTTFRQLVPAVVLSLQPVWMAPADAALQQMAAMRQPQMRVLLAEADVLALRADAETPMVLQGVSRGAVRLSRLQLRRQGGSWWLQSPELGQRRLPAAGTLVVQTDDPRGIWLGPRRYSGALHLALRDGRLQVVNHLDLETYLASVVGSEMPQAWPMAALQAQAVAARTYALRQRGRKGSFDVKATVSSQVYRGLESATPRTEEAVNSTRSLVMVHGGRLINAVFHSSSGGSTEPSGEVWRHQLPYLVSVPDHDQSSPVHRWEQQFDAAQLRSAFRETGGLQKLEVLQTSSTGRLRSVRAQGPRGSLVISGRELRQRLGLKSTKVRFNWMPGASNRPAVAPSDTPIVLVQHRQLTPPAGVWRDSASGTSASTVSRDQVPAAPGSRPPISRNPLASFLPPPPPPPPTEKPLVKTPLTPARSRSGAVLTVQGQGFGHGVGMSQWGARGLAEQGADFRQILQHYYRGITIRPFRPADDPAMAWSPLVRPAWKR